MSLFTAEALVLDAIDLHDADRIVTFLTRERGTRRGVARAARRKYSRFSGQLQPLAKVRITWFEKPERDLVRISSVETVRGAGPLLERLEDILLAGYLAEHLMVFAQENEENERLFRLLDSTVEALLGGVDRGLAARYFEVWVLRLSGIFPSLRECAACGRALDAAGASLPPSAEGLECAGCGVAPGSLALDASTLALLQAMRAQPLARLAAHGVDPRRLSLVEELATRIRRSFLQRELKSYAVMKRTLAEVC